MMVIKSCLTIVFDGAFYKAIFEQHTEHTYAVAQLTLGTSEPKMPLILNLVNQHYNELKFHEVDHQPLKIKSLSPKRAQRLARKAIQQNGISTKAQLELQKQREEAKKLRKRVHSQQVKITKEELFLQKQAKRQAKHRGH